MKFRNLATTSIQFKKIEKEKGGHCVDINQMEIMVRRKSNVITTLNQKDLDTLT